jgi:hypothetical protein
MHGAEEFKDESGSESEDDYCDEVPIVEEIKKK